MYVMRIRLVDDWRDAHMFMSVRLSAIFAALFAVGPGLIGAWNAMPDDLKVHLPHGWARWIASGGFVLIAVARVLQKSDPKEAKHE